MTIERRVRVKVRSSLPLGTSCTPDMLKQAFRVHSVQESQKKGEYVAILQSKQKKPDHEQIMDMKSPPRVAWKTNSPVKKGSAMDKFSRTYRLL